MYLYHLFLAGSEREREKSKGIKTEDDLVQKKEKKIS
jgi:hypothetical protein